MNINTRNLLLKLKNCSAAKLNEFYFRYSQKNLHLLEVLYNQGLVQSFTVLDKNVNIHIILRYFDNKPVFEYLKLFSLRLTSKNIDIIELSRLFNKRFILFLTTNRGIYTLYQCKVNSISGKILFLC